jgi:hypothetical protein
MDSGYLIGHRPSLPPTCPKASPSISPNSRSKPTALLDFRDDVLKTRYRLSLDPRIPKLEEEEKATLLANIQLLRDFIVFFTATGAARGVSGHTGELTRRLIPECTLTFLTGGAYDTVPEVCILLALFNQSEDFIPIVFDEAGEHYIDSSVYALCHIEDIYIGCPIN